VLAFDTAFKVTVPPSHIGLVFVGAAVGTAFTVTVVVYTVDGLQPLPAALTVNE
jgi:hypothetical protein